MDYTNPLELPSYNPQTPQFIDSPKVQSLRNKLEAQYELALELRLDGYHYEMIQSTLKRAGYVYSEHTIRDWFSANGSPSIKALFDELKQTRAKEILHDIEKAREILNREIPMALAVFHRGVADKHVSRQQIEIAKEILDRSGFGRQTKVEGAMQVESESMKRMAEALKAIAHRTS